VLINVVGLSLTSSLLDLDTAHLDAAFAHNFRQHLWVATAFARAFDADRGTIVMVNSTAGVRAALNRAAYGASKAALRHMTRIWDEELASEGVRLLSIDPGDMDTPLHALAVPDADPATLKRPAIAATELVDLIAATLEHAAFVETRA
jgi:NAD(P)-dependent dehydrogenase (short-subunit alcohol dehydrogenase family)